MTTVLDGYDAWDLLQDNANPSRFRLTWLDGQRDQDAQGQHLGEPLLLQGARGRGGRGQGPGDGRRDRLRAHRLHPRERARVRALLRPRHRPPGGDDPGPGDVPGDRRDPVTGPLPEEDREHDEDPSGKDLISTATFTASRSTSRWPRDSSPPEHPSPEGCRNRGTRENRPCARCLRSKRFDSDLAAFCRGAAVRRRSPARSPRSLPTCASRGDAAVAAYALKFDGARLKPRISG
jgi:hypothetical protein